MLFSLAQIPWYTSEWLAPLVIVGTLVQLFGSTFTALIFWAINKRDRNISTLESRLIATSSKLIDDRFNSVQKSIDEVNGKLKDGDETFRSLEDRDQKIELHLSRQIDTLKDWIRDSTVSATQFAAHEKRAEERDLVKLRQLSTLLAAVAKLDERTAREQRGGGGGGGLEYGA